MASSNSPKIPISIESGVSLLISLTLCLSSDQNQREIGKSLWEQYSKYLEKLLGNASTDKFAFTFMTCLFSHFRAIAVARGVFMLRRDFLYTKRDLRVRFYEKLGGISSLNYEGVMSRLASAIVGGVGGFAILEKLFNKANSMLFILLAVPLAGIFYFLSDFLLRKYSLHMSDKFIAETHENISPIWRKVAVEGYVVALYSFIEQFKELQQSSFGAVDDKKYVEKDNILALIKRSILELNPNYSISVAEINAILSKSNSQA